MKTNNILELILTLNAEAFKKGLGSAGTAVRTMAGGATSAFKTLTATGKSVDAVGSSAHKAKGKIKEMDKEMGSLDRKSKAAQSSLAGVANKLLSIAAIAGAALFSGKSAMDFESAMADVAKVVDGTKAEIDGLRESIVGMSRDIPLTASQLAAIAAEAGALGIAVDDIEEFTRTVAKMSTAFDMTAEDAGNAIGKIKNIFGLSLAEMTTFGDTVNQLGNTTAAKEREIVDSMMRIGGSANQFGLATTEAAALSAAFISLGKTPETAATAINSLLAKLQTAESQGAIFQDGLAEIGISASDLAADIKAGPNEAIIKFLENLKKLDGAKRATALVKLFGTEFQDDIGVLVTGLDSYKHALNEVADASSYAGGMQKEFETRSRTSANQLILTKNAVKEISINIGTFFLPTINKAFRAVADFTTGIIDFVTAHPDFSKALTNTGDGLKKLFADISASRAGEILSAMIRSMISALEELAAMVASGEFAGYLAALGSQWSAWADDVTKSIDFVGRSFGSEMNNMESIGATTVAVLIDAFRNFPANVRAFIGLITVSVASEFDKIIVRARAFKDTVAALFNDKTIDGVTAERDRQLKIINEARDETIDSILKERDTAIDSTNKQIEASKKLREEYEKRRAVEAKAKASAPDSKAAEETKKIEKKKIDTASAPVEKIKTAKEEKATKKAEEKEKKRLEREEKDREKAEQRAQAAEEKVRQKEEKARQKEMDLLTEVPDAKEKEAEEPAEKKELRQKEQNDQSTRRYSSAEQERTAITEEAEEDITRANADRVDAAKQGAEEWAQAETQAVEKAKSVFQRYADKVKSLQNEIVGRERSLAEELDSLDTKGTAESRWRRKAKEAKEYEQAAKAAMKAGDLDKALALSDQAKAAYSGLKGGAGSISDKIGNQSAFQGVKASGLFGIEISKAIQAATAKTALTAMSGADLFGNLTANIRGQLAAVAGGGSGKTAGQGAAPAAKVHELRFAGGSMRGSEADVEALFKLLEQSGMTAG